MPPKAIDYAAHGTLANPGQPWILPPQSCVSCNTGKQLNNCNPHPSHNPKVPSLLPALASLRSSPVSTFPFQTQAGGIFIPSNDTIQFLL